MNIDNFFDELDEIEYEEIFPEDQEYNSWMAAIERDYAKECEIINKLEVGDKVNIVLDDLDDEITDEDLEPYEAVQTQQ